MTIELAKGLENTITGGGGIAGAPLPMFVTDPFSELGLSTAILVVIIVFHGWSLGTVTRFFSRRFALYSTKTESWRINLLTAVTIAALVFIHLFETFLWTTPIWRLGIIPSLRDAYYYVLEAYTTLGEGNVQLPYEWRLAGPVIAISGLFTFGWTASVLVYVMNEIGKLHSRSSREDAGIDPDGAGPK